MKKKASFIQTGLSETIVLQATSEKAVTPSKAMHE
jgi:hypothetical protein